MAKVPQFLQQLGIIAVSSFVATMAAGAANHLLNKLKDDDEKDKADDDDDDDNEDEEKPAFLKEDAREL